MEEKEWRGDLLRGIEHRVVRGNEDRRNEDKEEGYKQGGNKGGDQRFKGWKSSRMRWNIGGICKYGGKEMVEWGGGTFGIGCGRVRDDVDGGVIQDIYDGVSGKIKEGVRGKKSDSAESGFRKGMGTIDNIYVLNYLINRSNWKGEGEW